MLKAPHRGMWVHHGACARNTRYRWTCCEPCLRVREHTVRCYTGGVWGGMDGHDLMCVRVVPIVYTSTRVCVMVNRSVYTYKYIIHACIRMCLFICDARGSARADVDGRSIPMHDKPSLVSPNQYYMLLSCSQLCGAESKFSGHCLSRSHGLVAFG